MHPNRTRSTAATGERVRVLLPLPLSGAYDYSVPAGLRLEPGAFVRVPLGSREVVGVVWGGGEGLVDEARLKAVGARLAVPPMPQALRRFVDWVAGYTLSPPGAVLRMAMSVPSALEPPRLRTAYALGGPLPRRLTPARERVVAVLGSGPPRPVGE
ncbi:MAG: primosomal protein N', partial [Alphaproteobacteria bacterium]